MFVLIFTSLLIVKLDVFISHVLFKLFYFFYECFSL